MVSSCKQTTSKIFYKCKKFNERVKWFDYLLPVHLLLLLLLLLLVLVLSNTNGK